MSTETQSLDLTEDELAFLAASMLVASANRFGDRMKLHEGILAFEQAVQYLTPNGAVALTEKMERVVAAFADDDAAVPEGGIVPPSGPTIPEAPAAPLDDAARAVLLTPADAKLIGIALDVASSMVMLDATRSAIGAEAYGAAATEMGLDAQENLQTKLLAQFPGLFNEEA